MTRDSPMTGPGDYTTAAAGSSAVLSAPLRGRSFPNSSYAASQCSLYFSVSGVFDGSGNASGVSKWGRRTRG